MAQRKIYDLEVPFNAKINDNRIQRLIRFFEVFEREDLANYGVYYTNKKRGVCLKFEKKNDSEILKFMFFYGEPPTFIQKTFGESETGYSKYTGLLPYGFSMNNSKKEVESQIGTPDVIYSGMAEYNKLGLKIQYFKKYEENSKIKYIEFFD